ncbi:MAG TPA: hypothetical protein VIM58_02255, partial [Candidatus Methylacidiphilales bacterium]
MRLRVGLLAPLCLFLIAAAPLRALDYLADAELQALVGKPAPALVLALADGTQKPLSDFKGRWVFLSIGPLTSPTCENVGMIGSGIQEQLQDRPFDFVQVALAPTAEDAALSTLYPFHGIQAVPAARQDLEAWKAVDAFPANYLVDPDGTVVFANHAKTEKQVRDALNKALRDPLTLPSDFAAPPPERDAAETALITYARNGNDAALPLFKALLAKEPENAWARGWLAMTLDAGREDGLTRDGWLARELENPARSTDPLQFLLLKQRMNFWKATEAAPLCDGLSERHPKSVL